MLSSEAPVAAISSHVSDTSNFFSTSTFSPHRPGRKRITSCGAERLYALNLFNALCALLHKKLLTLTSLIPRPRGVAAAWEIEHFLPRPALPGGVARVGGASNESSCQAGHAPPPALGVAPRAAEIWGVRTFPKKLPSSKISKTEKIRSPDIYVVNFGS